MSNEILKPCPFCGGELEEFANEFQMDGEGYLFEFRNLQYVTVGATCNDCGIGIETLTSGLPNKSSLIKENRKILNRRLK